MPLDLDFTMFLARGDDEIQISVSALASYNRGTPGTLSDSAGWEVDILRVTDADTGAEVELTDADVDAIRIEAVDHHI